MLHTALVISAYMSMIFVPCACAQWGEVLTAEWRTMRRDLRLDLRRRRDGMSEVLIRSLRDARARAQIAALASLAFVEPAPLPRIVVRSRRLHLGRPRPRVRVAYPINFQRAVARVRMRLSQLSEAFRLANPIFDGLSPAFAMSGGPSISMATPRVSMANIAPPMVNFKPARIKEPVAPPAARPEPAVAKPEFAQPAIAANATQPEIRAQVSQESTLEDRLTRRLFDQVGAFRHPEKGIVPKKIVAGKLVPQNLAAPQEIRPSRLVSLPAAIEPSPLLHFPPSPAELEALFALESPTSQESSDAVRESSVRISAAA